MLLTLVLLVACVHSTLAASSKHEPPPVTCAALPSHSGYSLSPASCASGTQTKGVTCTYTCSDDGMVGSSNFVCTASSQWTGSLPACKRAACPIINHLAHGTPGSCGGTKYTGDVCMPTCDNGYTPANTSYVCHGKPNGNARWVTRPHCIPVACAPLANPTNGVISDCDVRPDSEKDDQDQDDQNDDDDDEGDDGDDDYDPKPSKYRVGTQCSITCNAGYSISGTPATCQATGPGQASWTFGQFCVANSCSALPSVNTSGTNSYTSSCRTGPTTSGGSCTLTCSTWGYTGSIIRSCTNGVWSASAIPTCTALSCTTTPLIANVVAGSCVPTALNAQCTPACLAAYSYVGGAYTCVGEGVGVVTLVPPSSASPQCVPRSCPSIPPNSAYTSDCPVTLSGGSCVLTCAAGTVPLSGVPIILNCIAGAWSYPSCIACVPDTCDVNTFTSSLGIAAAFTVNCPTELPCGEVVVGDICTISCAAGYGGSYPAPAICGTNGIFTGPGTTETCVPITCPPMTIAGGSPCPTSLGSTCPTICAVGYLVSGAVPTCIAQSDPSSSEGVWSAPAQVCSPVPCSPFSDGTSSGCSTALGSTCNATCPNGYGAVGTAPICVGTAPGVSSWSGPAQTCVEVNCTPFGGYSIACNTALGSTCEAACPDIDVAQGVAPTCIGQAPGVSVWSGPAQTCYLSACTSFGDVASAGCSNLPLTSCPAVCAAGYCASGPVPQCVALIPHILQWTGPEQSCLAVSCVTLQDAASVQCGTDLGTFCYATCADGYSVTGIAPQCVGTGVCTSDWSGPAQTCTPVPCAPFTDTTSNTCDTSLGATCLASCPNGYGASGTAPQCTATGSGTSAWSGPAQTCDPINCLPFTDQSSSGCNTTLGSTCLAICPDGYSATGTPPQCVGTAPGVSSWSGLAQTCVAVSCPMFTDPSLSSCSTQLGSICNAICPNGYSVTGTSPQCVGTGPGVSAWTGPAQTCSAVPCAAFTDAASSYCSTILGSTCFAICPTGYSVTGTPPQCVGTGPGTSDWSGPAQTCIAPPPPTCTLGGSIDNGSVGSCVSVAVGSSCTVSCNSGYAVTGSAQLVCQNDLSFIGSQQCSRLGNCLQSLPGSPYLVFTSSQRPQLAAALQVGSAASTNCTTSAAMIGSGVTGQLFAQFILNAGPFSYNIYCDLTIAAPCIEKCCAPVPTQKYLLTATVTTVTVIQTVGTCCAGVYRPPYALAYTNLTSIVQPCSTDLPNDPLFNVACS